MLKVNCTSCNRSRDPDGLKWGLCESCVEMGVKPKYGQYELTPYGSNQILPDALFLDRMELALDGILPDIDSIYDRFQGKLIDRRKESSSLEKPLKIMYLQIL